MVSSIFFFLFFSFFFCLHADDWPLLVVPAERQWKKRTFLSVKVLNSTTRKKYECRFYPWFALGKGESALPCQLYCRSLSASGVRVMFLHIAALVAAWHGSLLAHIVCITSTQYRHKMGMNEPILCAPCPKTNKRSAKVKSVIYTHPHPLPSTNTHGQHM